MSAYTIYADLVGKIDFLVYNAGVDAVQRADFHARMFHPRELLPETIAAEGAEPSRLAVVFAEEVRVRRLFCLKCVIASLVEAKQSLSTQA